MRAGGWVRSMASVDCSQPTTWSGCDWLGVCSCACVLNRRCNFRDTSLTGLLLHRPGYALCNVLHCVLLMK